MKTDAEIYDWDGKRIPTIVQWVIGRKSWRHGLPSAST